MSPAAEDFYAEIIASAATLARLIDGADLTRRVPTCPEWTLRQLATHVGRGQRWAAEIVSTRSPDMIPFREAPDGRLPDDPAAHAVWLTAGAERLVGALRSAGETPVWTFLGLAPAAFWARRMAHETAVHRADGEIATGTRPRINPVIGADGVDEWLEFLSAPRAGQPDARAGVLAGGRALRLNATDAGAGRQWLVRATPDGGVAVEHGHGGADTALRGSAGDLLLVLTRRLPPDDPAVEATGDRALLADWLAATPF